MQVKLISATPKPEELVATAARNDYRPDGVIDHSFRDVMKAIEADEAHNETLKDEGWRWEEEGHPWELEAKKRTLIDHLMRSDHWGPFEHPQATIALQGVTRVLMAQITRHRHASFDIMSLRYVNLEDEFDRVPFDRSDIAERFQFPEFRGEDFEVDREGVHEFDRGNVDDQYAAAYSAAIQHYKSLLNMGVPPEQARKVLPMGTKVNIVVSMNARAWMHILAVRTKADVQWETKRCADAILDVLEEEWMPYTFGQFRERQPIRVSP